MKNLLFFTSFLLLGGCGPGTKDGEEHISHGYYFSHFGGDQNFISYIERGNSKTIIGAKVEVFFLHKGKIYISRSPVTYKEDGNVIKTIVKNICEYWVISLSDNIISGPMTKDELKTLQEWGALNRAIKKSNQYRNTYCSLN